VIQEGSTVKYSHVQYTLETNWANSNMFKKTYGRVHTDKHSSVFHTQNNLKKGVAILSLLLNLQNSYLQNYKYASHMKVWDIIMPFNRGSQNCSGNMTLNEVNLPKIIQGGAQKLPFFSRCIVK
jgi:hypothetical protein